MTGCGLLSCDSLVDYKHFQFHVCLVSKRQKYYQIMVTSHKIHIILGCFPGPPVFLNLAVNNLIFTGLIN